MSPHTLAIVAAPDLYRITQFERGVNISVWTTKAAYKAQYALSIAPKALRYFADYTALAYPLAKLDIVAIPDLQHNSVPSWGLLLAREDYLLVDWSPDNVTLFGNNTENSHHMLSIAKLICQGVSYQWFGNTMSPRWWTDLWVSAGLANYMSYMAMDHIFPSSEIDVWSAFVYHELQPALAADSMSSTHQLQMHNITYPDLALIFDDITFRKGASIMRMLYSWMEKLQPGSFQTAIKAFVRSHQMATYTTHGIWASFQSTTKIAIQKMVSTWGNQIGYPVVYLERPTPKVKKGGTKQSTKEVTAKALVFKDQIATRQHPSFLLLYCSGGGGFNKTASLFWSIPVNLQYSTGVKVQRLEQSLRGVVLPKLVTGGWIKGNWNQTGYYRMHYQQQTLPFLRKAVLERQLPAVDRAGVVDDLFAMGLNKDNPLQMREAMTMVKLMHLDTYVAWAAAVRHLVWMRMRLTDKSCLASYTALVRTKVLPQIIASTGWGYVGSHSTQMIRKTVYPAGLLFGDPNVISWVRAASAAQTASPTANNVPSSSCLIVYGGLVRAGGAAEYNHVLALHKGAEDATKKSCYLLALGFSLNAKRLTSLLTLALSATTNEVATSDLDDVVAKVAESAAIHGKIRNLAWDFVKQNWDKLEKKYGTNKSGAQLRGAHSSEALYLILNASRYLQGKDSFNAVKSFLKEKGLLGARISRWALKNIIVASHFSRVLGNKAICKLWL